MAFTDDDLKQLKQEIIPNMKNGQGNLSTQRYFWIEKLESLIARLEAAEQVIDTITNDDARKLSGREFREIQAWRKAAGK